MVEKRMDVLFAFGLFTLLVVFIAYGIGYGIGCQTTAFKYQLEIDRANAYIRQLEDEIRQLNSQFSNRGERRWILNGTIPALFNATYARMKFDFCFYGERSDIYGEFNDVPVRVPYNWSVTFVGDQPSMAKITVIYYVKVDDGFVRVGEAYFIKEYPYMEGD